MLEIGDKVRFLRESDLMESDEELVTYIGQVATVYTVEKDFAGLTKGWFFVKFEDGEVFLLNISEVEKVED